MNIKKVIYDDIENLRADVFESTTHYIVDYENGNFEFFLDMFDMCCENNNNDYDYDAFIEAIENYFRNGFFVADPMHDNIEMFKNEYSHLFEEGLVDELYKAFDACKVVFEEN